MPLSIKLCRTNGMHLFMMKAQRHIMLKMLHFSLFFTFALSHFPIYVHVVYFSVFIFFFFDPLSIFRFVNTDIRQNQSHQMETFAYDAFLFSQWKHLMMRIVKMFILHAKNKNNSRILMADFECT